jgi:hypothetical protein
MTVIIDPESGDTVDALRRARWFCDGKGNCATPDVRVGYADRLSERISGILGLLVTSLEELKWPKRELDSRTPLSSSNGLRMTERTRSLSAAISHRTGALVVTDIFGTIQERT